jgi:hypothetical protein
MADALKRASAEHPNLSIISERSPRQMRASRLLLASHKIEDKATLSSLSINDEQAGISRLTDTRQILSFVS